VIASAGKTFSKRKVSKNRDREMTGGSVEKHCVVMNGEKICILCGVTAPCGVQGRATCPRIDLRAPQHAPVWLSRI
jgi:hypothetical protein